APTRSSAARPRTRRPGRRRGPPWRRGARPKPRTSRRDGGRPTPSSAASARWRTDVDQPDLFPVLLRWWAVFYRQQGPFDTLGGEEKVLPRGTPVRVVRIGKTGRLLTRTDDGWWGWLDPEALHRDLTVAEVGGLSEESAT